MQKTTAKAELSDVKVAVDRNYRTFVHYNRQRRHIMRTLLDRERSDLLDLIPVLFHINNYRAPGYVADLGANVGVHQFKVTDEIRQLKRDFIANAAGTSLGLSRQAMIDSICSIGSAGTLAQTDKSDFDLWIVCRNNTTDEEYELIGKKAKLIKTWLLEQDPDLDLNFYLATPARVKRHYFGAVSDDSAGSALGKLLKEEFYRTFVVWAGKVPLWFCFPHDVHSVEEYEHWSSLTNDAKFAFAEDLMDMGPVERGTPAQLLSAVLWQTNKSLSSPFKSLLKLSLVNKYADEPETEFVAEMVRRNVQTNPTHGRATDPYLCLFDTCANYWQSIGDKEGVRLMCEMFFLKMFGSGGPGQEGAWDETVFRKRTEVRDLLQEWGLGRKEMRELANIHNWDFRTGIAYRARTQTFVKRIFDRVMHKLENLGLKLERGEVRKLRPDADEQAAILLGEFANISSKVDCFYGATPRKVVPVPPSFRGILQQRRYTLIYRGEATEYERWTLAEDIPPLPVAQPPVQPSASSGNAQTTVVQPGQTPSDAKTVSVEALASGATASLATAGKNGTPGSSSTDVTTRVVGAAGELMDAVSLDQLLTTQLKPAAEDEEIVDENDVKDPGDLLIHGASVLHLVSWLSANRLASALSAYRLIIENKRRPVSELRRLVGRLAHLFRHPLYEDAFDESQFKKPPHPIRAFVSFDLRGYSQLRPTPDATRRLDTGDSDNGLTFQPDRLTTMSLAEQDSYGIVRTHEIDAKRYSPEMLFGRMLACYGHLSKEQAREAVLFHAADEPWHQEFCGRFALAFKQANEQLSRIPLRDGIAVRYVARVLDDYAIYMREGNKPMRLVRERDMAALLAALERPVGVPVQTFIDPGTVGPERMREIFRRWTPGVIQIFIHRTTLMCAIHVLDEAGCYYTERVPFDAFDVRFNGLLAFLTRLSGAPLRYALREGGKVQIKLWDITNESQEPGQYSYRVQPYQRPTERRDGDALARLVVVRLEGEIKPDATLRLEIMADGTQAAYNVLGKNLLTGLFAALGPKLAGRGPNDLCLLEVPRAGSKGHLQTLHLLDVRRSIERAVRAKLWPNAQTNSGRLPAK